MGYTIVFQGSLKFNRKVTPQMKECINRFSNTIRIGRNIDKLKQEYPNWKELCFFGDLGKNGAYFAPMSTEYGQKRDDADIDQDSAYENDQPGSFCQWVINDNDELVWDGGEKFFFHTEWLEYLIKHFFAPLDYILNGEIKYIGELEAGIIIVKNNVVFVKDLDDNN